MVMDPLYHVKINGLGYIVASGTYRRHDSSAQAVRLAQSDPAYEDLSAWSFWGQEDWVGGIQRKRWTDKQMYSESDMVDTTESNRIRLAQRLLLRFDTFAAYGYVEGHFCRFGRDLYWANKQNGVILKRNSDGTWGQVLVLSSGVRSDGVLAQDPLKVTEQTPQALGVTVAPGRAEMASGTSYNFAAATNLALVTADATNPRIDLVYVSSDGVLSVVTGTPAATPAAPALPAGGISLAQVAVAAAATLITNADITDTRTWVQGVDAMEAAWGYLWVGNTDNLVRYDPGAGTTTTYSIPSGTNAGIMAMRAFLGLVWIAMGRYVYAFDPNAGTWDSEPRFKADTQGIRAMEVYSNRLFFLGNSFDANNYADKAKLYYTDGVNFAEAFEFPKGFVGFVLRNYSGWLYIGGGRYSFDYAEAVGELWALRGSTVEMVREFAKELTSRVAAGFEHNRLGTIYTMCVADGKLWLSANGHATRRAGLICYDAKYDAFSYNSEIDLGVDDRLNLTRAAEWIDDHIAVFIQSKGIYVVRSGRYLEYADSGDLYSSEFDAGLPRVKKLWHSVTVRYSVPQVAGVAQGSITVHAIIDGTDVNLGAVDPLATEGTLVVPAANRVGRRIQVYLVPATTDITLSPEIQEVSVRYLLMPEPKAVWQFSLWATQGLELMDRATLETRTPAQLLADLWAARAALVVAFVDRDGVSHDVVVRSVGEAAQELTVHNEATVAVTLLEV